MILEREKEKVRARWCTAPPHGPPTRPLPADMAVTAAMGDPSSRDVGGAGKGNAANGDDAPAGNGEGRGRTKAHEAADGVHPSSARPQANARSGAKVSALEVRSTRTEHHKLNPYQRGTRERIRARATERGLSRRCVRVPMV